MKRQESDSQIINVYGDKYASRVMPAYQRQVSTRPVTFQCIACKQTVTQERFPGPTPKYCSDACATNALEARNKERVRQQREKRQAAAAQRKAQKAAQQERDQHMQVEVTEQGNTRRSMPQQGGT